MVNGEWRRTWWTDTRLSLHTHTPTHDSSFKKKYADVVRLENYHFFVQTMSPRQQRLLGSTALLSFIDQAQVRGSVGSVHVSVRPSCKCLPTHC